MSNKNSAAKAAAQYVSECLMHRHRGVIDGDEQIIVFGNDSFEQDERSQEQVDLMKKELAELGLEVAEFGTCKRGRSWAMVVPNADHNDVDLAEIERRLWTCWGQACGMDSLAI